MEYVLLHTTTDSPELARDLAAAAVSQRLAACVQIVPIESVYIWEDELQQSKEFRCEMKSRSDCLDALKQLVLSQHTYDLPELVVVELAELSADYRAWLDSLLEKPEA